MGQTPVTLRIYGPAGSADVEALADTGATFTKVRRSTVAKIGSEAAYESSIELADGGTATLYTYPPCQAASVKGIGGRVLSLISVRR